jgi:hypothetical protein
MQLKTSSSLNIQVKKVDEPNSLTQMRTNAYQHKWCVAVLKSHDRFDYAPIASSFKGIAKSSVNQSPWRNDNPRHF